MTVVKHGPSLRVFDINIQSKLKCRRNKVVKICTKKIRYVWFPLFKVDQLLMSLRT